MEQYCKKQRAKKPCESRPNGKLHHEYPENEERAKLYIPCNPNTDYLMWHTQLYMSLVNYEIMGYYSLIFQSYLMYSLICQKPAHFLSAQMALVSNFFQMFIVHGMYNFAAGFNFYHFNAFLAQNSRQRIKMIGLLPLL